MLRRCILGGFVVAFTLASAAAVRADKPKDKGKGRGRGHAEAVAEDRERERVVVFSDRDRDAVRGYWTEAYGRGNCPPGLAKKADGCLPPGLARRRYVVGRPLPTTIVVQPMPAVLVTRLGPPPAGYEYAIVDGDIVKLAVGTRLVVDAIRAIVR